MPEKIYHLWKGWKSSHYGHKKRQEQTGFWPGEAFKRNFEGMWKRPVSIEQLEKLVDDIESQIHNSLQREVTSKDIGEMVMAKLKNLDEVAYVRFASVYRQFKDINTFMDELRKLLNEK